MVLPFAGAQGKKDKKRKKGKQSDTAGDGVQVNLIVDPNLFRGRDRDDDRRSDVDDRDSDAYTTPGAYSSSHSSRGPRKRPRPRRSIFASLAQEAMWREERKWLTRLMLIDICGIAIWGALFVFILIGKRCPSGRFDGWCTGYNVASAAACLLCVTFCLSTYFDVKDLYASRVSPRTR